MAFLVAIVALLASSCIAKKNGCWNMGVYDKTVSNCTPIPPVHLCAACPLRVSNVDTKDGDFKNCKEIFNTANPKCMKALGMLFSNNHKVKKGGGFGNCKNDEYEMAYKKLKNGQGGQMERMMMDRVVYNLCEFCCDIVKCGNGGKTYQEVTSKKLGLIDAQRANGPLHLFFDNCDMWPDMKAPVGKNGEGKWEPVCPLTVAWKRKKLTGTQNDKLKNQLNFLSKKYGCSWKRAWIPCSIMEHRMSRINFGSDNC